MSESPHPRADELSSLSTVDLLRLMHGEDRLAVEAVENHLAEIAAAVDAVAGRLSQGGRLHYFGAGTSGRLAALDAAECAPTFGLDAGRVHAHDAGDGEAEDDDRRGTAEARQAGLGAGDAVVGVSAGGRTAYVLAALAEARRAGSLLVGISCSPGSPLGAAADLAIEIESGPEVIAGSTRLKAGTVQKVVLNMLSTGVFTKLGHTYRGRMVGVVASNEKLRHRAARIVADLSGAPPARVETALAEAGGSAKLAILMLRCGLAAGEARSRLSSAGGDLSAALGET
jgi:N-acetylmuramic acid 6-phosphate etherase